MDSSSTLPPVPALPHFGLSVPFMHAIGLQPQRWGEGKAVSRLPWREDLTNSRGDLQGGSLMTALDFTMSAAARSAYDPPMGAATVDMHTSFLDAASGPVMIEARCLRVGRSLAFCEADARDDEGNLVAKASATFRMIKLEKSD